MKKNIIIRSDVFAAYHAAFKQRSYEKFLLVGKSIGTLAMGHLLSEDIGIKDVHCIWLTPLLSNNDLRKQIQQTKQRSLFVAGTGDRHYKAKLFAEVVNATQGESKVITGADHCLEFSGDIGKSIVTLGKAIEAIRSFVEE